MKRTFLLIIAIISSVSLMMAEITVTVPKKGKIKLYTYGRQI